MIEQIKKLRTELTSQLKSAAEMFSKQPENTEKALTALFRNMELLNEISCNVLEMTIYNRESLKIISSHLEDQNKLLSATRSRLNVFGPPT